MTILVEFQIATERFKLGEYVTQHDDLQVELERIVPIEDHAVPYVWVTGPPQALDALTETFDESDAISSVTTLDRLEGNGSDREQQLYRIEWVLDELDVIKGIVDAEGVMMEGQCVNRYWTLRIRFPDHDHIVQFYKYLADNDITDFSIQSVIELQSRSERGQQYELTSDQREAMTLAAQRGYFDTPRRVTLDELGEELGISEQAISQRIRRANKNIIFAALNYPKTDQE
ncbi:MAG: helix-turn-helix domain-containing protein [Haloarculaceae archaeon]